MTGLVPNERKLPTLYINGIPMQYFLILGGTQSGQIVMRDLRDNGVQSFLVQAHAAPVLTIMANDTGTKVVSSSLDGFVKIWSISYQECEAGEKHLKDILSPKGRKIKIKLVPLSLISVASGICKMMVYDGEKHMLGMALTNRKTATYVSQDQGNSFQEISQQVNDEGHVNRITGIAYLPILGLYTTCSTDGAVKVWEMESNRIIRDIQFSEPLDAIEFASERGDLIVSKNNQIVLLYAQDYLPPDLISKLLPIEWVDDPIEDPEIFDINSNFWNRSRFNRRIVDDYPTLWNQLKDRFNIGSWEQDTKSTMKLDAKMSQRMGLNLNSVGIMMEDGTKGGNQITSKFIDDDDNLLEDIDPMKVNIPDYQFRAKNGKNKMRIYDELEKDGPIVYNVPEMELEKMMENGASLPETSLLFKDNPEGSSENAEENEKMLRQEIIDKIERNKMRKAMKKAKAEEEKRLENAKLQKHLLDIPRPNAAGQQEPVLKDEPSTTMKQRSSIVAPKTERNSVTAKTPDRSRKSSQLFTIDDDEPFDSDGSSSEQVDATGKKAKKGKGKKKKTAAAKKMVHSKSKEELAKPISSTSHEPKVPVRLAKEITGNKYFEYFQTAMLVRVDIPDAKSPVLNDFVSFSDAIMDKQSFFMKNKKKYEVPGSSVVDSGDKLKKAGRSNAPTFKELFGDVPKPVVEKESKKTKAKKKKKRSERKKSSGVAGVSVHIDGTELESVESESSAEESDSKSESDSDLDSDNDMQDALHELRKRSVAEFDAASVAWSLFKAAILQNKNTQLNSISEEKELLRILKTSGSKSKVPVPAAVILEKYKAQFKTKHPRKSFSLAIPERHPGHADRAIDELGLQFINSRQDNNYERQNDELDAEGGSLDYSGSIVDSLEMDTSGSKQPSVKESIVIPGQEKSEHGIDHLPIGEVTSMADATISQATANQTEQMIPVPAFEQGGKNGLQVTSVGTEPPVSRGLTELVREGMLPEPNVLYTTSVPITTRENLLNDDITLPTANTVEASLGNSQEHTESLETESKVQDDIADPMKDNQKKVIPNKQLKKAPLSLRGHAVFDEAPTDKRLQDTKVEFFKIKEMKNSFIPATKRKKRLLEPIKNADGNDPLETVAKAPYGINKKHTISNIISKSKKPVVQEKMQMPMMQSKALHTGPTTLRRAALKQYFENEEPFRLDGDVDSLTQEEKNPMGYHPDNSQRKSVANATKNKNAQLASTVDILAKSPWFPDFKGKEVNVHSILEALLSVIKGNTVDQEGKVEAALCIRFLMETFKSEVSGVKNKILEAHLDTLHQAQKNFKIQLIKNISAMNISSESVVVNLICALNDADKAVSKAAVDALGFIGINSREELYNRMQEYHILNDVKLDSVRTNFVHPLDIVFARIQDEQRLFMRQKMERIGNWRMKIDEKIQGTVFDRPDSSHVTLIPKLVQKNFKSN